MKIDEIAMFSAQRLLFKPDKHRQKAVVAIMVPKGSLVSCYKLGPDGDGGHSNGGAGDAHQNCHYRSA